MFEDSTFESAGRIRTRSRGWMIAAFALNGSIVLATILFPLIYPQALPRMASAFLMLAPPPQQMPPPPAQTVRVTRVSTEMMGNQLVAPRVIPATTYAPTAPEPPGAGNVAVWGEHLGLAGPLLPGQESRPVVREAVPARVRISSGVMDGMILRETVPVYPPVARAMGLEGTVELQATISKTGTIENLHAVAGPMLLRQAALDAVSTWVYRPYLLNGQPVEVETTINVEFKLH